MSAAGVPAGAPDTVVDNRRCACCCAFLTGDARFAGPRNEPGGSGSGRLEPETSRRGVATADVDAKRFAGLADGPADEAGTKPGRDLEESV